MFANLFKYYIINTALGAIFTSFLVLVTGIPMTSEDYIAFMFFGWFFGWLARKIFRAQVHSTKDAIEAIKNLRNKE